MPDTDDKKDPRDPRSAEPGVEPLEDTMRRAREAGGSGLESLDGGGAESGATPLAKVTLAPGDAEAAETRTLSISDDPETEPPPGSTH